MKHHKTMSLYPSISRFRILGFLWTTVFLLKGSMALADTAEISKKTSIQPYQELPAFLEESSGLCESKEGIWSINDSHNPSHLYLLKQEAYTRWIDSGIEFVNSDFRCFIIPELNTDWEAVETDGTYIYIGDFGNNLGNRKDLRILRISITDLLNGKPAEAPLKIVNSVIVDKSAIHYLYFRYPEQKKFQPRRLHRFDCEAMIIRDSQIWLLSKNWNNLKCQIYSLDKRHFRKKLDSSAVKSPRELDTAVKIAHEISRFNPRFLVTDATVDSAHIYVCGYGPSGNQYIGRLSIEGFCQFKRLKIPLKPAQMEGIHFDSMRRTLLLSTESRKTQKQALFSIEPLFIP